MAETGKTPRSKKPVSRRPATARTAKPAPKQPVSQKSAPVEVKNEAVADITAADLVSMGEDKPVQATPSAQITEKLAQAPQAVKASEAVAEETESEVEQVMDDAKVATGEFEKGADKAEQKGTEIMSDVMATTKKYTEETKARFENAFSEMNEKAKVGVEKSTKAIEELGELTKGNVEAMMESGKIASKGMETLGQDAAEYGRMTFEKASAAMKSLAAAKSPTEFFQLQSELMSSSFDAFAKETAKNSEAFLKLAGDVVQPISTRVSVVTEKVRTLSA